MRQDVSQTGAGYTTDGCDNVISFVDYVTRSGRKEVCSYITTSLMGGDVICLADHR